MHSDIKRILFDENALQKRVEELGRQITQDYAGQELLLIGILRGAAVFMADLIRHIKIPISYDFMAVSSYGDSTRSSGVVRIQKDLNENVEGRHVLIVEDIVDTGLTLKYLLENLQSRNSASVKICCLLDKPDRRKVDVPIDYEGFSIPDLFVVGYGLDYAQRYRNLPYIGILRDELTKK